MFIFGIIIIVAVLIFRGSFKVIPEDRHFQDKLKVRQFATFGGFALAAILVIASLIRIVPAGNVGVQVLFGKVLTGSTLSEGLNVVNPFIDLEIMTVRTQAYTMSFTAEEGKRYGGLIRGGCTVLYWEAGLGSPFFGKGVKKGQVCR